jgi:altronate dehydratase small subunit
MEKFDFTADGKKAALMLDQKDNVATVLADCQAEDVCIVMEDGGRRYELTVIDDIPFGHKVALDNLEPEQSVYKYGEEIGRMKQAVKRGGWIHSHNMYCDRGLK